MKSVVERHYTQSGKKYEGFTVWINKTIWKWLCFSRFVSNFSMHSIESRMRMIHFSSFFFFASLMRGCWTCFHYCTSSLYITVGPLWLCLKPLFQLLAFASSWMKGEKKRTFRSPNQWLQRRLLAKCVLFSVWLLALLNCCFSIWLMAQSEYHSQH